jgi:hypothetical protein
MGGGLRCLFDGKFSSKHADGVMVKFPRSLNRIFKVGAAVAVALALPALAFAGGNNQGGNNNNQGGNNHFPVVPEANTGWVLIPVVGAVLRFSARRLFPAKA